jgi:integrase
MTVPPSPRSAARLHTAQTFRLPNIGANLAQQPRHRGLDQPQLAAELEFRLNGSLVLLLGVGGLRWGEAAALRVGDVDFLRRRISLHRNAVAVGSQVVVGTL